MSARTLNKQIDFHILVTPGASPGTPYIPQIHLRSELGLYFLPQVMLQKQQPLAQIQLCLTMDPFIYTLSLVLSCPVLSLDLPSLFVQFLMPILSICWVQCFLYTLLFINYFFSLLVFHSKSFNTYSYYQF